MKTNLFLCLILLIQSNFTYSQNKITLNQGNLTMKKIINTPDAPSPIGPYSQAVITGNTLYVSGQIAIDPKTNQLVIGDIKTEAIQVMNNIKAILNAAGAEFKNVVKSTIFLKDMNDFAVVNEVYGKFFTADFPARETIQVVGLPKNVNVEISVVAVLE